MMQDMRSAMQYLQGKVLCQIPVYLAYFHNNINDHNLIVSSAAVDTGNIGHGVVPHWPSPAHYQHWSSDAPSAPAMSNGCIGNTRWVLPSPKPE
ncbi:unnamed protein product [Musa textilis]